MVLSLAYTNLDAHNDSGVRLKETPENVFSIWNNYLVSDRLAVNLGIIHQDESHITNGSTASNSPRNLLLGLMLVHLTHAHR